MSNKKQSCKELAHMIFKRIKSCGCITVFKERFTYTEYEKDCYNKYYGQYGKL